MLIQRSLRFFLKCYAMNGDECLMEMAVLPETIFLIHQTTGRYITTVVMTSLIELDIKVTFCKGV